MKYAYELFMGRLKRNSVPLIQDVLFYIVFYFQKKRRMLLVLHGIHNNMGFEN